MHTCSYPRPLQQKEYQAILRVQHAGKEIDYKEIHKEILRNKRRGCINKPVYEAIYKHYF